MTEEFDLFALFRHLLVIFGVTYSVVKAASLLGRVRTFSRSEKTRDVLLRQYIRAHWGELDLTRFLPDAVEVLVLLVVFGLIVYLHLLWVPGP